MKHIFEHLGINMINFINISPVLSTFTFLALFEWYEQKERDREREREMQKKT